MNDQICFALIFKVMQKRVYFRVPSWVKYKKNGFQPDKLGIF